MVENSADWAADAVNLSLLSTLQLALFLSGKPPSPPADCCKRIDHEGCSVSVMHAEWWCTCSPLAWSRTPQSCPLCTVGLLCGEHLLTSRLPLGKLHILRSLPHVLVCRPTYRFSFHLFFSHWFCWAGKSLPVSVFVQLSCLLGHACILRPIVCILLGWSCMENHSFIQTVPPEMCGAIFTVLYVCCVCL